MKRIFLLLLLVVSYAFASAQVAVFTNNLSGAQGICSDGAGNIYVLETGAYKVKKITPTGVITTVAGNGASGFSGDGGQATAAALDAYGLSCDLAGNLYIGDWYNNRVRKVDASSGIITTIAGNGSSNSSGDGGVATAAGINSPIGATADNAGNIFISEYGAGNIRRIDAATGIITTVATGISGPCQIVTDHSGNVFVAAQGSGRIYKITPSYVVSAVAGGGSGSGSGILATSAGLSGPEGVAVDVDGNIFIADNDNGLVREVDSTGIITTLASAANQWTTLDIHGNLYFTDGGSYIYKIAHASAYGIGYPAIPMHTICIGDTVAYGYTGGTWSSSSTSVATIDSFTGVAHSISAGTTTISFAVNCCGTLSASLTVNAYCSGTPIAGSAYILSGDTCGHPDTLALSGCSTSCGVDFQWQSSPDGISWSNIGNAVTQSYPFYPSYIAKHYRCALTCASTGSTAYSNPLFIPAASGVGLHTVSNPLDTICMGAIFSVSICTPPSAAYSVKTWYGDGTSDVNTLSATSTPNINILHNYPYPGTYSVKQIVYDGVQAVDSASFSYEYLYCSTLPLKFYIDADSNNIFDAADYLLSIPVSVEVDSNGIVLDTISVTSGVYYHTLGGPGTVYAFIFLHDTSWITNPASGIIYDTISSFVNSYSTKYMGVKASSVSFDLAINPVIPVTGVNDQWGHIYVQNNIGLPANSTIKLSFDSRWYLTTESYPMPEISGDTATWTLSLISPMAAAPTDIYYVLRNVSTALPIGDIVRDDFSVFPFTGDADINNNIAVRNDTVKGGCDPNYLENLPAGCLPFNAGPIQIQYNIHFENTGNDTAHNIYVLDTLSPGLNPHSLKIIMSSASMNISMFNAGGYNIVKFDLPDINLLDSSHHGLCDGSVMYTINTRPGLPDATIIDSRAGIYFDTNPVVLTNTAENVIGCPETVISHAKENNDFKIYPNPVSDELIVDVDTRLYKTCIVTNGLGQTLMQQSLAANETKLNIHTLPPGLYYIHLVQENGNSKVGKFIKL